MSDFPPYTIIRSHRRSISLHFDRNGQLVVKAPHLVPEFIIKRFMNDKRDWILRHQKEISQASRKMSNSKDGDYLYLGKSYKLRIGNVTKISVTDMLNFPAFLQFRMQKELMNWYKAEAKCIISKRVGYFVDVMQVSYRSLTVSDTLSKWGSCSKDNALQFSWRLVMAPLLVVDYVVVHELAHTRHKHHQQSFWREVKKYKPAYKQYLKWLKDNSHTIHSILPK